MSKKPSRAARAAPQSWSGEKKSLCRHSRSAKEDLRENDGGFGLSGIPENIIEHVRETDITDLTAISTESGDDDWGLARLIEKDKIRKQYASYIGRAKVMEQAYLTGRMELELIPQGTLAEKVRCAGASIPAFYSVTGLNTLFAEGKLPTKHNEKGEPMAFNKKRETREFGGKTYMLEEAFPRADFAWIKATKVDKMGNCMFKGTSQNFNVIMAKAAHCTIVECEEIVEVGSLKPEEINLPALYVNRVFKGAKFAHKVEVLKVKEEEQDDEADENKNSKPSPSSPRDTIALRAAHEFRNGMQCNLGVGIPTLAAAYASQLGITVMLQSENGMMGVGDSPRANEVDSDWINAGKETVTPIPGSSTFGSDESFAQIRGGHLDMCVLGALEVSQFGDLANFMIPGKMVKGMGGAMDLVSNPEQTLVLITMTHTDKHGNPKIKKQCKLPLTGAKCVHTIVTDLAVFDVDHGEGLTLREYNPKSSIDEVREKTEPEFRIAEGCRAWET